MVEPDYYSKNGLSPLQAFEQGLLSKEQYVGFCKGNVIKYTIRAGEKTDDPLLDIVKAMDYLHHLHRALKEPDGLNVNVDINGVDELENKLNEVKDKIDDFKDSFGIRYDDDAPLGAVLTYNDEDLEYFKADFPPAEDDSLKKYKPKSHLRPKVIKPQHPNKRSRNWLSKFKDKTIGIW